MNRGDAILILLEFEADEDHTAKEIETLGQAYARLGFKWDETKALAALLGVIGTNPERMLCRGWWGETVVMMRGKQR